MSVRDSFEISGQLIPDARSGKGEGAFTKSALLMLCIRLC